MKYFVIIIVVASIVNLRGLVYAVNGEMDSAAYCFFLSIFSIMGIAIWKIMNDDKNEDATGNANIQIDQCTAFNIMKKALADIGCQPTNEGNSISVAYQGENFQINCDGIYATIWDPAWSYIKAGDTNLPKIRDAVNAANVNFGPIIILGEPNDNNDIVFHTKRDIMLHPSLPDASEYIRAELDAFFPAKNTLMEEYKQIDLKQKKAQKERRPIGFTTQE